MTALIFSALGMGLLGSLHCVGMCGPIALALPVGGEKAAYKRYYIFLYSLGRAVTYAAMGIVFGAFGYSIFLSPYQSLISIGLGLLLLINFFSTWLFKKDFLHFKWPVSMTSGLYRSSRELTQKSLSFLSMGMVNGLLPCGLVYTALAGAVVAGTPIAGALFMFMFGLGTWPLLALMAFYGKRILTRFPLSFINISRAMMLMMALLFIIRGMQLDIPYLSPAVDTAKGSFSCCHKK